MVGVVRQDPSQHIVNAMLHSLNLPIVITMTETITLRAMAAPRYEDRRPEQVPPTATLQKLNHPRLPVHGAQAPPSGPHSRNPKDAVSAIFSKQAVSDQSPHDPVRIPLILQLVSVQTTPARPEP